MFDFDASKLLIIGIVALVFIPSKDLPRVLRQLGQFVGKMRRMASEFQTQFMDAMREADMSELKREADKLAKAAELDPNFPGVRDYIEDTPPALPGGETVVEPEIHHVTAPHEIAPPALVAHESALASAGETAAHDAHPAHEHAPHEHAAQEHPASDPHPPLETASDSAHPVLPSPAHDGA